MDYLEKYGYKPDDAQIASRLQAVASTLDALATPAVLKKCFSLMDLTTLKSDDTVASVSNLVDKVSRLQKEYPSYPLPASVCVYPNLANVVLWYERPKEEGEGDRVLRVTKNRDGEGRVDFEGIFTEQRY